MTADLRAVRRNDWEDVAELVRHAGTIHQNAAFNRIRAALASTPEPAPVAGGRLRYAGRATPRISLSEDDIAPGDEPAPVAEGLREALHDAMEEDANQRGWGESKTTDLPMEEVHRVIDAVFLRYAAASPSPETE